jgi:stage II sporulation protein D
LILSAGQAQQQVAAGQSVAVSLDNGLAVSIGARPWRTVGDTLSVTTSSDGRVRVGDRAYRGSLRLFRATDASLAVVNVLGLEEYLFGVVPCEIGPINSQTIEAAKAQAVAARSFTLTRLGKRKGLGHDLFDSYLRDQEYRGTQRETDLATQAVTATAGEVLMYAGAPAEALYHGNCGGATSNGSQPYLRSVRDTPGHRAHTKAFCADSPSYSWQVTTSKESLDAVIARLAGLAGARVQSFRLDRDRQSGRVKYLEVTTTKGKARLQGADFRAGMGLKSQNFEMTIRGASVLLNGRGWGHGSGMCQDGAVAMARAGNDYRRILKQYYSGVVLKRLY